jgi:hypothetical protein
MASRAQWRQRVAQWKRSGLTADVFAAEHDINPRTLLWWSSMLRRPRARAAEAGFVRLVPVEDRNAPSTVEPAPLDIVLSSGRVVRVRRGFDPTVLRELLAVLEAS